MAYVEHGQGRRRDFLGPPPQGGSALTIGGLEGKTGYPSGQLLTVCRLTRELEKKLSDKFIVFLSQRRVLPKQSRSSASAQKQKRPRSRTLTAVHEKILEELVFPSEIVGKRTRVAQDGSKLIRV